MTIAREVSSLPRSVFLTVTSASAGYSQYTAFYNNWQCDRTYGLYWVYTEFNCVAHNFTVLGHSHCHSHPFLTSADSCFQWKGSRNTTSSAPNSRQTQLRNYGKHCAKCSSWKAGYFTHKFGVSNNRAARRAVIELTFIRWTETQLQMTINCCDDV